MFENTFQGPGFATYTNHTLEILIMLLVAFLLGLLLGYILWYRWRSMYADLETDYNRLKALHTETEKDNLSLKYKCEQLEKESADFRQKARVADADLQIAKGKLAKFEADFAAASAGATASAKGVVLGVGSKAAGKPDDLKKIEGIGPKIEKLCNAAGISTFRELANTSIQVLQKILDDGGPAFRLADPATWPQQADLAADGKWDELKKLQDFLTGGKVAD
jgi:predicted flap endonuclease-1-like 5' DNA nuclease